MESQRDYNVFLVSDGTGETGGQFLEAALLQFEAGKNTSVRKFPLVRTREDIDRCIDEADRMHPLILHTLVSGAQRDYLASACHRLGLKHLDMLSPIFSILSELFQAPPMGNSGMMHAVNNKYFQRIDAIEFTLRHDDGRLSNELHRADIVILGVSRTSKTPTSVFLAQKGYKVVNVPIVLNMHLPEQLFQIEQKKIVGLTINPARLADIRRTRMVRMGAFEGEYADLKNVMQEVEYAEGLFRRHRHWPIIDVTDRAIEETADHILNTLYGRDRHLVG